MNSKSKKGVILTKFHYLLRKTTFTSTGQPADPEYNNNGVFTPEQDNDKTTRQMLNLCIPMMPFTPSLPDLVWKAS